MRTHDLPIQDRLLEAGEAAKVLGIRKSTVYQWAYQRKLPVVKLFNKSLRFRESVIRKLIADSERPALPTNSK
jgi:excisionase family DNA binding protein